MPAEQWSVSCCKCHVVGRHQYLNTLSECTSRMFSIFILAKRCSLPGISDTSWGSEFWQMDIDMGEQHTKHIPSHTPSVTTWILCNNSSWCKTFRSFKALHMQIMSFLFTSFQSWRKRCKEGQKSRVWNTRGFHCNLMNAVLWFCLSSLPHHTLCLLSKKTGSALFWYFQKMWNRREACRTLVNLQYCNSK